MDRETGDDETATTMETGRRAVGRVDESTGLLSDANGVGAGEGRRRESCGAAMPVRVALCVVGVVVGVVVSAACIAVIRWFV